MTFKKILVATDFSDCSLGAVKEAGELARKLGGEIILCTSLEAPEETTLLGGSIKPLIDFPKETADAEKKLRQLIEDAGISDVAKSVRVTPHAPGEEVPELAEKLKCDLIVVGTHGRTGWRHFVIGSVTERIIRKTEIPVLAIPCK
ncbi:MAG TPA: universal stress protein [Planctomycetes bacterium]|nr:universal stress protein [Planctomycetota bacterium]